MTTEKKISTLLKGQIPQYILTEYPHFVEFMEAYYEWLEENRQVTSVLKNFPKDQDIDTASFGSIILTLSLGTGDYEVGETVFQGGTSISNSLAKGTVFAVGDSYIEVTDVVGRFNTGFGDVIGLESGASYSISDINIIDASLNDFVRWFKNEFIPTVPQEIISDPKNIIKHARQFYRAKGTQKSYRFLFRILFNESIGFYYPWTDLIRPSDAKWEEPRTLKVKAFLGGAPTRLEGQQIRGRDSLSTALVENVQVTTVNGIPIYELFLNRLSIQGQFFSNELIESINPDVPTVALVSTMITGIDIIDPGTGYTVGQVIEFTSDSGSQAQAQITAVGPNGEITNFRMNNFGAEYSLADPVTVDFPPTAGDLAFGAAILGTVSTYPGFFLNDDGMPNATKYIQDGVFYQQHSYVIKASQSIDQYRKIVTDLLHPAGLVFFGEFESVNKLVSKVRIGDRGRACAFVDIVRQTFLEPNEYPTVTEAQNPNLKVDNNISSSVCIIKMMQAQASSSALGPTIRSLDRSKRFHLPYEDFATKFPELDIQDGSNAGYWNAWANYQLGQYGTKYTFEEFLKTPYKKVAIMPEPRYEISTQAAFNPEDFVTEWQTNSLDITLPLAPFGTYNFVVDWGDGNQDTITTWNQPERTHTYAEHGTYQVKITGTCTAFRFINTGDRTKIRRVINWGETGFSGFGVNGMFHGCTNLVSVAGDVGVAFDSITDFSSMFRDCTSLTNVPLIDLSGATSVFAMFRNCSSLTSVPLYDLSNQWSTSQLFFGCSSLTSVPAFDLSSAVSCSSMFSGCASVEFFPEFTFGIVTNLDQMFSGCSSANSIGNITSGLDIRTCQGMFFGCSSLVTAPQISTLALEYDNFDWFGCISMFSGCSSLEEVDLNISVDDVSSNDQGAQNMFLNCPSLESVILNGMNIEFSVANANLNEPALEAMFDSLSDLTPKVSVVRIDGNPGAILCDKTVASNKNWSVDSGIQYPDWNGADASNWSLFETALQNEGFPATPPETLTTHGITYTQSDQWSGGVLAPNGRIIGIPFSRSDLLNIFTPSDGVSTFGSVGTGTFKWAGGVLAPNGFIYGIPFNATSILKVNPITLTTTTFGFFSGTSKWNNGVLGPDGIIYCSPVSSTSILKIDPSTDTTSTVAFPPSQASGHGKMCLAPNGHLYFAPTNATTCLKFDPVSNTFTTFGSISASTLKYQEILLGVDGNLYCIPYNATEVMKIDPATDTVSFLSGTLFGSFKYFGGSASPQNLIYSPPYDGTSTIGRINTNTDVFSQISTIVGTNKYRNSVFAPNGKKYFIPYTNQPVRSLDTGVRTIDINFYLSRFFNRI